ncbi:hypothetical protein CNMCM7691_000531 [Aspergillus felis]|uniref:Protein YAE1 n=1 Tax=Aspergillus felis TaxID=1287682 RepID=A0A8H6QYF4_9EURO|nr:hypothetical protein CNMCM7691_000531 [Aspergillus felis]
MTSPQANSLDDIFGSSPPHENEKFPQQPSSQAPEPSDLPSLRRQHVTAGYRDGVSAAKGEHVQHGFDAGFPIGAQLGMRAGTVIGIIEGLLRGFESRTASRAVKKPAQRKEEGQETEADEAARQAKREQLLRLYQKAVKELEVRSVFAGSEEESTRSNEGQEKPEVVLRRKGDAVISQWEDQVRVAHWEENMAALEPKEGPDQTHAVRLQDPNIHTDSHTVLPTTQHPRVIDPAATAAAKPAVPVSLAELKPINRSASAAQGSYEYCSGSPFQCISRWKLSTIPAPRSNVEHEA